MVTNTKRRKTGGTRPSKTLQQKRLNMATARSTKYNKRSNRYRRYTRRQEPSSLAPNSPSPVAPGPTPPVAPGPAVAPSVYCGNTRIRAVQQGLRPMGTRHTCLKKGYQIGRFVLPPDIEYARAYLPVDNRAIYCGVSNVVPTNHIRGKLPWCLSKGIGKGKRVRALQHFGGPQP